VASIGAKRRRLHGWCPRRHDPESAIDAFVGYLRAYRVRHVTGDRYGGVWPQNRFRRRGIDYGLAQCAVCGGGVYVTSRSHGRRRAFFYACTSFHRKGRTVCANNQQVVLEDAEAEVMAAVEDDC
jgi:hypothetical protein